MLDEYETDDSQWQYGQRSILPPEAPVTGESVVRETPLVPIIPYAEPQASESCRSRTGYLKNHIGEALMVKLNDSSIYTGVLVEVGSDFFNVATPKKDGVMMFDVHSIKYIRFGPGRR